MKYQKVKREGTLHMISFTTVFNYLFHLREMSILLEPLGSRVMVYLAAAVSDFYIHPSNMVPYMREYLQTYPICTVWYSCYGIPAVVAPWARMMHDSCYVCRCDFSWIFRDNFLATSIIDIDIILDQFDFQICNGSN